MCRKAFFAALLVFLIAAFAYSQTRKSVTIVPREQYPYVMFCISDGEKNSFGAVTPRARELTASKKPLETASPRKPAWAGARVTPWRAFRGPPDLPRRPAFQKSYTDL